MRALLVALVACYAPAMGLGHWDLTVQFEPGKAAAWTAADPTYLTADIGFDTTQVPDTAEAHWLVKHELAHLQLWELGELAETTNQAWALRLQEQTATIIARWPIARCP